MHIKMTYNITTFKNVSQFVVVKLLSHVWLFAIPRTAARQASLFFTISLSLLKLMSIESMMPSNHLILWPPSPPVLNLSQDQGLFRWDGSLHKDGQSTRASASASVLLMNIQSWLPLGLTGLIFLWFKGLSSIFSNTTAQKHQFFSAQLSSQSNSHIYTWLLEKPQLWPYRSLLAKWCLCFIICGLVWS